MKIIFSRKGFDSQYGGVPSPILKDGTIVSLPIPSQHGRSLHEIAVPGVPLDKLVSDLTGGRLDGKNLVHLDPDLRRDSLQRAPGWKPSFGQVSAAQGHLRKQGVGLGDIFLFFGWYRQAEMLGGNWRFVPGAPDIHSLFGWLQVGEILAVNSNTLPSLPHWIQDHPHVVFASQMATGNTLYVAADKLFNGRLPGAGIFDRWTPRLQLTAVGKSRSFWRLPAWMHPEMGRFTLSYHGSLKRWQLDGDTALLKSVAKGQEFVMDLGDSNVGHLWLTELIQTDANGETS